MLRVVAGCALTSVGDSAAKLLTADEEGTQHDDGMGRRRRGASQAGMTQVFHPAANAISRASLRAVVVLAAGAAVAGYLVARSDYITQAHVIRPQPIEFSHQHHVGGLGIDCRYCHGTAETSATAGLPSTEICMNCHAQIWSDSPKLALVRQSLRENPPIVWTRVTDLPDYVHFNHRVHVNKGVGCVVCHGRVDQMPLAWREHSLQMQWCVDCHRAPEPHLVARPEVFSMTPATPDAGRRRELAEHYHVRHPTDCSACHY